MPDASAKSATAAATQAHGQALADFHLDILGQQPLLKIYTQICHCYGFPGSSSSQARDEVVSTLEKGLDCLARAFPWTAGQVANTGAGEGRSGIFTIEPLASRPQLVVRNLTTNEALATHGSGSGLDSNSGLTWGALEEADFPIALLHEDLVAPRTTLPIPTGDVAHDNAAPVLLVQATFIPGGLLLCFAAHHGTMDGTGQGRVISWLSRACAAAANHEDDDVASIFTAEELRVGNLPRKDLIPSLSDGEYEALDPEVLSHSVAKKDEGPARKSWHVPDGDDDDDDIKKKDAQSEDSPQQQQQQQQQPPKCHWANFSFSPSSLATLKAEASRHLSEAASPPVPFISTDDALTALVWSSVARTRVARLTNKSGSGSSNDPAIPLARALNVRPYFSLPDTYPGLFQNMTYHALPLSTFASPTSSSPSSSSTTGFGLGLAAASTSLRKALLPPEDAALRLRTRALATYMRRVQDTSTVSFTADLDSSAGLALSSWAGIDSYALDFGLRLGNPASVRRPAFTPVESLAYFLPKDASGEVGLAICLREEEMGALRSDPEWQRFARYIG